MTTARAQQISLADTAYYQIMSRCVRRFYFYAALISDAHALAISTSLSII